jgi:heptose I phosphotransferase
MRLEGKVYREHKHRRTLRVELDGRAFFVKVHGHTGPIEIIKHAARGRWPVLTAANERAAIKHLETLGVPTMKIAGYGCRGRTPARLESFIITEALDGMTSLEEVSNGWCGLRGRALLRLQRAAIAEVAGIARTLHENGLNHRDFYLCHFLVPNRDWSAWQPDEPLGMHVIDLHRAQLRRRVPTRLLIKDLAGLLFSALDAGLTDRDYLRFLAAYRPGRLRDTLRRRWMLRWIVIRAVRLYRAERGRSPRLPACLASFAGSVRGPAAAPAARTAPESPPVVHPGRPATAAGRAPR